MKVSKDKKYIVNTKDLYEHCTTDEHVEISGKILDVFHTFRKVDSLNKADGIENSIVNTRLSSREQSYQADLSKRVKRALSQLTDIQKKRLMLHCLHDLSMAEIARREGVTPSAVKKSIERSKTILKKLL